ncbi:MAG: SbcC/MukB-like Walker B domain-containing protein, partial [bacterium]
KEFEKISISLSKLNGIFKSKIEELNLVNKKIEKSYKDFINLVNIFIDLLDDLKEKFLFLYDFIEYLKSNFDDRIIIDLLRFDDKFINEVILRIPKIQQKIKLKAELIMNEDYDEYFNFFIKLKRAFLNKIKFNIELINNLLVNYGLLDLSKYIDSIIFIFNEIREDIKKIKNDILFFKSNINIENNLEINDFSIFFDNFLNYIDNFVQFKTEIDKDELIIKFNDFIKRLKSLFENFKKSALDFDDDIDNLKAILELKIKLNNIKGILDKKISELSNIKKDHDYLFDSLIYSISEVYSISEKFYSFNIDQMDFIKVFEFFKDINNNLNNLKSKISSELDKIDNSLNTKKESFISFKQELNNYINNFEIIFNNLNKLKEIYNDLDRIKGDYELIQELYNDFVSKSKIDVISFLSKKLFDLLYFNTNNVIEKITEGRYNLFINESMDIFIKDNWYSVDRGVRSLSGGEKFLTSLSLALSISEISSKSKYPIKSLFIDEGFSTLDVDTLNDVMEYLENYFNNISDKVLGIITHIPEVKDKFNYIIEVIKDKNGSKINVVNKILENSKV